MDEPKPLNHAADLIRACDGLIIAAGAGMGIDSGLPDFRGQDGFWTAYPALGKARLDFTQIANPAMFEEDPRLAWGFYGHRLALYRRTAPHEGFSILSKLGQDRPKGYAVFTSNVDGHFQTAGMNDVTECHGSIHWLQCSRPCTRDVWAATGFAPEVDNASGRLVNDVPACPRCGAVARPNILMFNDWHWIEDRTHSQEQRLNAWLDGVERPLVIEIGAGTGVPTVRHFSLGIVTRHRGRLLRINPREFSVPTPLDVGIPMGALVACEGLQELV